MRRKKNAAVGKKPPIEFLESPPLHVPLRSATPVHSSLCPLTADVIPVAIADNVWISPQFHANIERTTRSGRKHLLDRVPSNHDASKTFCNAPNLVSKMQHRERRSLFRPLRFVGERTLSSKPSRSTGRTAEVSSDIHLIRHAAAKISPVCSTVTSTVPAPAAVRDSGHECLTESQDVPCVQFEIDTPDWDWEELNPIGRRRGSSSLRLVGADPSKSSDSLPSRDGRLLSGPFSEIPVAGEISAARQDVLESDCDTFDADRRPDLQQKQCHHVRDMLSSLLSMTPPPSSGEDGSLAILASDTPVSDYGLTYRQRALRYGRVRLPNSVFGACKM